MIAVASCSSDDTSGPATEPAVTAAPTTTEPDEVPSTPPAESTTTTSLATTTTSTAPPATTEPPVETTTTPTDPLGEDAAAAAVLRLFDLFTDCLATVPDCSREDLASNYVGGYQQLILQQVSDLIDGGFTISNTESRRNRIESVSIDTSTGVATVVACQDDGSVMIDSQGVVVNDAFVSRRVEWTLLNTGGRWFGTDLRTIDRNEGEENPLCDDQQ